MSSWMSRVGGIEKVTPARYDEADQSVNRQPTERMTSAETASSLPHDDAVSPIVSAARSQVSSMAPLPFHVVTRRTGPAARLALVGLREGHLGRLGKHVHRQVEQDRPGPAGQHLVPG